MRVARMHILHGFRAILAAWATRMPHGLCVILGVLAAVIMIILPCVMPSRALADHKQIVFFEAPSELLNPSMRSTAIAQLKGLGVKALRVELHWHDVAPDPNSPNRPSFEAENPASYDWGQYDILIDEAQR